MTRSRFVVLLLAVLLLAACNLAAAVSTGAADGAHSQIQFGTMHIDLSAEDTQFDVVHNTLTATGRVRIITPEGEMQGDRLVLDMEKQTGQVTAAIATYRSIILRAASLELLPDSIVAVDARISTCDLDKPHYEIRAKRAVIHFVSAPSQAGAAKQTRSIDRIDMGSAAFEYHGHRLITLPPFHITPRGADSTSQNSIPLPYPGYSKLDGPFVQLHWGQELTPKRLSLDANVRLTARQGVRALVYSRDVVDGSGDALVLALSRKEDLSDQPFLLRKIDTDLSKVLVSRQPELSFNTAPRHIVPSLRWDVQVAAGEYRQEPRGNSGEQHAVSDSRMAVTPSLVLGPFHAGSKMRLETVLAYRAASYGDGEHSGVFYRRFSLDTSPAPDWKLSLDLVRRTPYGSTPFRFDRVDVTNGLTTSLRLPAWGPWRVKLLDLYDLHRNRSRDEGAEMTYRAHCLDYTLGWRRSRGMFSLGVSLVGWGSEPN